MADDLVQAGCFLGRTYEPVQPKHLRLLGASLDQVGNAQAIAGGMQVAVVIGGQHGHGQDFQIRSRARPGRRLHGLRIGVHGQKRRAEPGDALDTARHRIADVVQLEIDKDLLAGIGELPHQRQASGKSQLITDLVKRHGIAEPRNHRFRRSDIRQIQRHNQPVARSDFGWQHVTSHHALGNIDQLSHQRIERLDIGRVFQPVHIIIGLAGE